MQLRSLSGRHCTKIYPRGGPQNNLPLIENKISTRTIPKLLVWSAADKGGVDRIVNAYRNMYRCNSTKLLSCEKWLDDLAYTLNSRRTHLPWRSFALLQSPAMLDQLDSLMSAPCQMKLERPPRVGFVFTGQGAQWFGMGRELLCYPTFKADLLSAEEFLRGLGCGWSVTGMCCIFQLFSCPHNELMLSKPN